MKSIFRVVYAISFVFSLALLNQGCNSINSASNSKSVEPSQITEAGLSWYKIDDLEKMGSIGNKKVLVDVYTDWCGWCKVMDKKTFTNPQLVEYLNDNFILVKFNAEQKEPLSFMGEEYEWMNVGRRGVNKLALKLLNGRLGYPTIVYLDENFNTIKASPGYKTPDQLMGELQVL